MPTTVGTTIGTVATPQTNLAADQQTYFSKMLLKQASYKTVLDQFAYKEKIPSASSKTISFTQYVDLPTATTPLAEGTTPTEQLLSTYQITATIDQLGSYTILTDLAQLTTKHPVVTKTNELLGTQAAKTYDSLINTNLNTNGTSVIYPGSVTSRATLVAGSIATMAEVKKAVTLLRNQGADTFADGNYVCVVDPSVEADLMGDTNFQNTVYRQTGKNENYKGAITTFAGVTFVRSNMIPTVAAGAGGALAGHTSYVFGTDAFAVTDLQTLQMYKQSPGGVTDPLEQRMTMGWKVGFKSVILNQKFMTRIESISAN